MDSFVRRENIKRYRKLLRAVQDEAGRQRILKLLTEAEKNGDAAGQATADLKAQRKATIAPGA